MLVNLISYEYNWLTVRARDLEILQTYLQLESNKDIIKINCENLKREKLNDEANSPVFIQLYKKTPPSFEEQKLFCKKTKPILNYWQRLRIKNEEVLVKKTKSIEHPRSFTLSFTKNSMKVGPERVKELCKYRFYFY